MSITTNSITKEDGPTLVLHTFSRQDLVQFGVSNNFLIFVELLLKN